MSPPGDDDLLLPRGAFVDKWLKRILSTLVIAFLLFYLFTRPEAAAGAVRTVFGWFEAIGRFFESLAR